MRSCRCWGTVAPSAVQAGIELVEIELRGRDSLPGIFCFGNIMGAV